jgi:transcriptional regulator with XRE-family HTH domain
VAETFPAILLFGFQIGGVRMGRAGDPEMPMTLHPAIQPDDDFLLDDGLPCLRRSGKLYYLGDMQPPVLEACRRVDLSFEQLAEKLGMTRPALLLILKGYDPVPVPLKSMLDRLVTQVGLLQPATSYCEIPADRLPVTEATVTEAPVHEAMAKAEAPPMTMTGTIITVAAEEVLIPQGVSLDRPAASSPAVPSIDTPPPPPRIGPSPAFTPGLRRTYISRASREQP